MSMFVTKALKYSRKVSFLVPPPEMKEINSKPYNEMVAVHVKFLGNSYLVESTAGIPT